MTEAWGDESFLVLLSPSKYPLCSITSCFANTLPIYLPPAKISTVLQSAFPSKDPLIIILSAFKSALTTPLEPMVTTLFETIVPVTSPSI